MRKFRVILCLILGLCFYGCGNVKNEGIYYPKVEEKEISERYNPSALYACQLLYDEGKIYTSAYELRGNKENYLMRRILWEMKLGACMETITCFGQKMMNIWRRAIVVERFIKLEDMILRFGLLCAMRQ